MGCIGSRRLTADGVPVHKDGEQHGRSEFSWEGINLSMEDTTSILPRLKRNSSNAYGIGALAKSSLTGSTRTMKERVTKPTGMAQGRVAHMIEWQNWGMSTVGPGGVPAPRITTAEREQERRLENDAYSDLSDGEKEARFAAGILQQFAISEATLMAWTSMDGDSPRSGSNQGSVAHLSEVNQESITSRDQILHHSSGDVWPHTYVSQGLYCLSSSDAWDPINSEQPGVASGTPSSYVMSPPGTEAFVDSHAAAAHFLAQQQQQQQLQQQLQQNLQQQSQLQQMQQMQQLQHYQQQQQLLQYQQQQALEHRLHSAGHSLQATPNSTIHSLTSATHPPLVDLWNTGQQVEAYPTELGGGYMGVAAVVEHGLGVPMGDDVLGLDHSPLLEQQEEEEELKEGEGVTLCLEQAEAAMLTPPRQQQQGDASAGGSRRSSSHSSPGQPPAELLLAERKASSSSSSVVGGQTTPAEAMRELPPSFLETEAEGGSAAAAAAPVAAAVALTN